MNKFVKNWYIPIGFAALVAVMILIISLTKSQAQNNVWLRWMEVTGVPTFKPSNIDPGSFSWVCQDKLTKKIYVYNKTIKTWEESNFLKAEKGEIGPAGPQGIPGIGIKGDKGDKGDQGPQGIPGSSSGTIVFPFTFPEKYGAVHANKTFVQDGKTQSYIDTNFPGIGATVNDPIDWAAWQMAANEATSTGKQVFAYGEYWFNTKKVTLQKYFRCLTILGGSCYINVSGSDGSFVFGRTSPTDNGDANIMIQAFVVISGIQVGSHNGFMNRVAFDMGPTYNSMYTKVDCYSLQEAIHLRFALNTSIDMCEAQYCIKGWTADIGNWPGAGTANSQSNVTTFDHCRFNATSNSDYAFGIYASSGVVMRDNIIEGDKVRVGVDYDAKNSTVVKSGAAYNTHFECVNGATEACFKLKIAGGIWVIDGVFGQHAAVMVDGYSYGGNSVIEVTHSVYWVPSPTGKYFKNSLCAWTLRCNGNLLFDSGDAVNKFSGTPVTYCNQPNKCSANTVTVEWVAN